MAITPAGGKMKHSTTEDVTPALGPISTSTGDSGQLAKSDLASLGKSFPASPIIGTLVSYDAAAVSAMYPKLRTNTCTSGDASAAAGYYGFSSPESGATIPSSADLAYTGAPDIAGVTEDTNGNAIASPYMPNLTPPDSFNPTMDNQDFTNVIDEDEPQSLPPGIGDGTADPSTESAKQTALQLSELGAQLPGI